MKETDLNPVEDFLKNSNPKHDEDRETFNFIKLPTLNNFESWYIL
jgi:hypothetical protein